MQRTFTILFLLLFCSASAAFGQVPDILGMAASLNSQSSELEKTQSQLLDKREELKKEATELDQQEKKVDDLKASAQNDNDPGPVEGPFYLFTGQYSNDASHRGASEAEAFGGKPPGGQEFASLAEAHAKAQEHMSANGSKQPSFRIEDSKRNVLESGSIFGSKLLPDERIANPSAPKTGNDSLEAAISAQDGRKSSFDQDLGTYKSAKTEYDQKAKEFSDQVDELASDISTALKDAGSSEPTAAEQKAPKGDYQVDDLKALEKDFKGKKSEDGKSVSFLKNAAKLPETTLWAGGAKALGKDLRTGTPIATFGKDGTFAEGKGSHAAIFVHQNKNGIWVYDQFQNAAGEQRPVDLRFIRNRNGSGSPSNDASAYSAIKKSSSSTK